MTITSQSRQSKLPQFVSSGRIIMDVLMTANKRRFTGAVPKNRSVTGPTPHSVAILGRPKLKRPPDWRIIERRKKEDHLKNCVNRVVYNETNDIKNWFLERTDQKIVQNTIQERVDSILQKQQYSLEERRERLRSLISLEEEAYLAELASKQETLLERQARMRERARFLRERREKERAALADEKLEQRWRDQCEELRGIKCKNHLAKVTKDRAEQLRLKAEEKKRQEKEEELYAQMWKEDVEIKSKREEMEAVLQIERNKKMVEVLNTQTAAHEKEKQDLEALREKEAELLREERTLRALEDKQREEERRRRQKTTKFVLDQSLKMKLKTRAREVQEELAFDMKLLEQMLTETSNEAKENLEQKKILKNEVLMYRKHLQEQEEEERRREKELDAIVSAEVERQWSKRIEQWKREAEARKKLLRSVLDGRHKQVEEKLAQVALQKAELEKEKVQLWKDVREHEELERQQQEDRWKTNKAHQRDLLQQMDYLTQREQAEKEQAREEWETCKEAEATYHRKVQEALDNPAADKLHPTRVHLLSGKSLL